jgi:hypothetical protein
MLAGAIPVVVGPVLLPLCDIIDWSAFIVHCPDWNDVKLLPGRLRAMSADERARRQALSIATAKKYFSNPTDHMHGLWAILLQRILTKLGQKDAKLPILDQPAFTELPSNATEAN